MVQLVNARQKERMMLVSNELRRRAQIHIEARRAQELDHTDPALNHARTEAHEALMMQLDTGEIPTQVGNAQRESHRRPWTAW